MNETWWVKPEDLDDDQREILTARPEESILIIGPPGSGKTNILMLRANYVRSVAPRLHFLTFTRTLTEFLRAGPNVGRADQIQREEISTFMAFGKKVLRSRGHTPPDSEDDFDADRTNLIEALQACIESDGLSNLYDVIFVDEVQDFRESELGIINQLASNINAAGDSRQSIFGHRQGLPAVAPMVGKTVELRKHYRIGRRICEYADRILPPKAGDPPMLLGCNYDESARESSVDVYSLTNLDAQIEACLENIRQQVRYIADEPILVMAKNAEIRDRFFAAISRQPDLKDRSMIQKSENYVAFGPASLIRVMTIASAKGSEARAVHILEAQRLTDNFRELAFTAVTRAKTDVKLYHTGSLPGHMQSTATALPSLKEIF